MGMPEYHDGNFGAIKPIDEALEDLKNNPAEQERTKALHIGKFEELLERAEKLQGNSEPEPLAMILQAEFGKLQIDVNKIMIHLGLDDKTQVLPVKDLPRGN